MTDLNPSRTDRGDASEKADKADKAPKAEAVARKAMAIAAEISRLRCNSPAPVARAPKKKAERIAASG